MSLTLEQRQRERIDYLEEENRQLKDLLGFRFDAPPDWRLTPMEAAMFGYLMAVPCGSREGVEAALCVRRPTNDLHPKTASVMMTRLRAKLRPLGVLIETLHGQGWRIAPPMRARARTLIAAFYADYPSPQEKAA